MDRTTRTGPDVALVRAARAGERRALDDLVAASLPLVYNVVGRALNGHADVDDVVQETLLRMVRYLRDLRDPASYRSWLVAIAVRQVRDREQRHRRTLHRRVEMSEDISDSAAADFAELTIIRLGLTDARREVAEATRWLGDEDRALLALWWLEEAGELGRDELARALDLRPAHAAVRVARMKEQMETARAVVRTVRASPRCRDLDVALGGWDGTPNPLWRKRVARHIRECATCGGRTAGMLPMERLLVGVPLVPAAPQLAARVAGHAASAGRSARAAHRTGRGARRLRHLMPAGSHAALAAVAVAAVVAGVVIVVQVSGHAGSPRTLSSRSPVPVTAPFASPSAPPSPSPSRSAAPSASPLASPSASPRPAAAVPATSSRKGVSLWSFDGVGSALTKSGASWYYTWSTTHSGITTPRGVQFVPMIWGPGSVTAGALAQAKAAGPYLLGFNEPDLSAQSNMSVSQALDLWPQLEATGATLGSPAVASGAADPGGWLDQFMSGAKTRGLRVDFITLHWYGSDFVTGDAVSQLKSYIQAVWQRYHKPIWLTEYALIKFTSSGSQYPSGSQQAAFVTASTQMLDGLTYVKRYAWFALPATGSGPNTGLFGPGAVATDAGLAFEKAR